MKKTLAVGLLSALVASAATYAYADRQPHMKLAREHLEKGLEQLQKATADKGGHRAKAIDLVKDAIKEVNAGIEFDNKH